MHLLDCLASLASLGAFKFDFLQPFWDLLMHSKLSVGLLDISATLCMHVHASNMSVGLLSLFDTPMYGFAPLAGRSHVTDMVADVFDLFTTFWTCMCAVCMPGQLSSPSVLSQHSLVHLAGKSSGFTSFGHVLTHLCVSPAICTCIAMPCMCLCMFGMPSWLLDSTLSHLPALIDKFCICGMF